ncbi:methylmalonyl-CoA epimerase [Chlorobium phaeovibrioides]|uniref:Methylmalonyl-CoA epimerase n=1 Tax=Chlorobium phaeovibrioides TaxID=1094 RepID=A0ABW9UVI8_CHLPH|nr:methylmalonyl-CoA epimerase [Chlorobium phaeovibrioides]MWV54856.1 methylmalonyl-CoA epimerase [Chlorobium phaeovibrioides]
MIKSIDHIAIAVTNLDDALKTFTSLLGSRENEVRVEEVPTEGVRVAFLPVGGTKIELLEPMNEESPIAKYLEKNGDGIHHIAFNTDSVAEEQERVKGTGIRTLGEVRHGAGGKDILFLHPKDTGRVLVELCSKKTPETAAD